MINLIKTIKKTMVALYFIPFFGILYIYAMKAVLKYGYRENIITYFTYKTGENLLNKILNFNLNFSLFLGIIILFILFFYSSL